jgi:hypothetical protein
MKTLTIFICSALIAFGQTPPTAAPAHAFPDQIVAAGLNYSQGSVPATSGFLGYAKLASASSGIYSYSLVRETSINLFTTTPATATAPAKSVFSPAVQTQTETGACVFVRPIWSIDSFACGTGGLAAAGGSTGFSASGTVLLTKYIGKGFFAGFSVGPSYSAVAGKVSYPVGIVFLYGK